MEIVNTIKNLFATKRIPATDGQLRKEISSSEDNVNSSFMLKKYNPDSLVGKKGLRIYQDMKTDDQVKASLTIKKFARLSTGWAIHPGDETNDQSVKMADFVEYVFKKMKGTFENDLLNLLTAVEFGYSLSEKVFGIYEEGEHKGKIGLMKLGSRQPYGYDFKCDNHNNVIGVVFENMGATLDSKALGSSENPFPPEKFVIYSYNSEHGNPYGTSDLRAAYAAWWSKKLNIKWWNIFNERFGMPTVMAKYPAKGKGLNKTAIDEIDSILKNLQAKSGFRTPDNITFELLEATRNGKVSYGEAINRFDGMIARAVLVPNLLGFQDQQEVGSYALGKKHFDVFMFVLEMMGRDLEEMVVGEQIIRPLIAMNFGEVDIDLLPKFKFESLEDDQSDARSKVVKILADGGLIDKREEWVREYMNLPERDLEKYPHQNAIGEVDKAPDPILPHKGFDPITGKPIGADGKTGDEPKELPKKKGKGKLPGGKPGRKIPNEEEAEPKKMALSRELTSFEEKTDYDELLEEMLFLESALRDALTPICIKWRDDIMKKADKLVREKDINGVNKLQLRYVGEFKTELRDVLVKTFLDSKLHAMEEIISVGYPATIKRKFGLLSKVDFAVEPWDPIPPSEALDFFNRKVIVTYNPQGKAKKNIPLAKSIEMNYYDKRAFTISGIESEYVLGQSKLIIEKGIRDGLLKDTQKSLHTLFQKYIAEGEIKNGKLLNAARLETIVRTNVNEALNEGRMRMFQSPDVKEFVPYLMWTSVLDNRTSPYCEGMDAKIFKTGEIEPPPAHFSCRSSVTAVSKPEIEEKGGVEVSDFAKESTKLGRATGFGLDWLNKITTYAQRTEPIDDQDMNPIVRCPIAQCGDTDIIELSDTLGTRTFLCLSCKTKFRVTQYGVLFIFEPGKEEWIRQTVLTGYWG